MATLVVLLAAGFGRGSGVGCARGLVLAAPAPAVAGVGDGPDVPTFNRDVAPVVLRHCAPCHRPAGSAPFPLLTYDDLKKRARQVVAVTASGFMPPWLPEAGFGEFLGERRLRRDEIELLRRWYENGAPRGDPNDPPPTPTAAPTRGWRLGKPDLVLTMPEAYTLPADGPDVFRNFVLAVPGDAVAPSRYVRATEVRPDNPSLVHHAVVMTDSTSSSRRLADLDPEPGFDGMVAFTNARSPEGQFVGWTPGKEPFRGYDDMAWRLAEGDDLVLQLHMLPSGKPDSVQVSVGLYFAERAPTRRLVLLRLGSKTLDIPPGETHYRIEDSVVLPVAVRVFGVYPHAHYLCQEMQAYATLPDGTRRWLLLIRDWDFNWQDQYRFRVPVRLPAGSVLTMAYTYDNSTGNPQNPNAVPRRVRFGPNSRDEMGDLWVQLLPERRSDLATLERLTVNREVDSRIEGYRFVLDHDPGDLQARFNLGSSLVERGHFDAGMAELRRVLELDPDRTEAHTNLGNALFARGDTQLALVHFGRAVELEPRSETHFNLANGLMAAGDLEEALFHFDQALEHDPDSASTHLNRGIALSRLGRIEDEMAAYEEALRHQPDYVAAHYNLAHALVRLRHLDEAVAQLDQALQIDPTAAPVLGARADALLAQGKLDEAVLAYRRLLDLYPNVAQAHYRLGLALTRLKKWSEAERALSEALHLDPHHPEAVRLLAKIRPRIGGHEPH